MKNPEEEASLITDYKARMVEETERYERFQKESQRVKDGFKCAVSGYLELPTDRHADPFHGHFFFDF